MLLRALPRWRLVRKSCERYLEYCDGDNDGDMRSNGELKFLRRILGQCDFVCDVGANVGDWVAHVLNIKPGVRIHAFEPCAATFSKLVSRGFPSNVTLNRLALSSKPGSATLHLYGDTAGTNSLHARDAAELRAMGREEVPCDTFDAYADRHGIARVDLVKLDVEGHEIEVLAGMEGSLGSGRVGAVQFEYGGCNIDSRTFLADLFRLFVRFGFVLFKLRADGWVRVNAYSPRLENFKYQNWVAVREPGWIKL